MPKTLSANGPKCHDDLVETGMFKQKTSCHATFCKKAITFLIPEAARVRSDFCANRPKCRVSPPSQGKHIAHQVGGESTLDIQGKITFLVQRLSLKQAHDIT